tara:strand:+ start:12440 stop:12733 length:294 start_codon:yes stop_codon:yes gene_type:complete
MSVDKELVLKISNLSKLDIKDNDLDIFIKNFKEIVEYIDLLDSVSIDTKVNVDDFNKDYSMRDDTEVIKLTNDQVLLNANNKEDKFFSVKKVIEDEE